MEPPRMEPGRWAQTVISKKGNVVRRPACKLNSFSRKFTKPVGLNSSLKPPKCYIKITGSRYNGTFLLNIDDGLDDAIYQTMRDIEVALEDQAGPLGKPRVSPKNCLSSVFQCFGPSTMNAKTVCTKKGPQRETGKPAACSLSATINKSDIVPLISAVQSKSSNPQPVNSNENVFREVVDAFRSTLDHFRNSESSANEVVPDKQPTGPSPNSGNNIATKEATAESSEALKKVALIKFSQEEVLVIQPPKRSNNDAQELEVGIEVKPKIGAPSVGQSIKLAKDKVLIGVQDGTGVLQISEAFPRRSLQMVIEEGVNGKPSMKLSMKEETPNHRGDRIPESWCEKSHAETSDATWKHYGDIERSDRGTNFNGINKTSSRDNTKSFKSVQSQVSWALLKDLNITQKEKGFNKLKCESTQYDFDRASKSAHSCHHCSAGAETQSKNNSIRSNTFDVSQDTCLDSVCFRTGLASPRPRDSRVHRMPYLVHTLYEPHSLKTSSHFVSTIEEPSTHHSSIGRPPISNKTDANRRQTIKPKKSFTFSSDHSSSSKCTKIFRQLGAINEQHSRQVVTKDASMSTSLKEDFEKILQNMCGSNYLYHQPDPAQYIPKLEKTVQAHGGSLQRNSRPGEMFFDQWTQTDNFAQERVFSPRPATSNKLGSRTESDVRYMKLKEKHHKSDDSLSADESLIPSGLEDELVSDSSDSNKLKLLSPKLEVLSGRPKPMVNIGQTKESWITGKAKSFVGQQIFAAIEDRSSQHNIMYEPVENVDNCIPSSCKEDTIDLLHGGSNISVVNMALLEGPSSLTGMSDNTVGEEIKLRCKETPLCSYPMRLPEQEEELDLDCEQHDLTSGREICPIRVRSKSCQNLFTTLGATGKCFFTMKGHQRKNLRFPHLTATDFHAPVNVCGILNLQQGRAQRLDNIMEFDSRRDHDLPPEIKSLLLPRQHSELFGRCEQVLPAIHCEGDPPDYWDVATFIQSNDDWYNPNEAAKSIYSRALPRNLFQRTFFAMKTVRCTVSKKFNNLFRKFSFIDANKRRKNTTMNDSVAFVAIPLKKKSENMHLFPKI